MLVEEHSVGIHDSVEVMGVFKEALSKEARR